jgi:ABC-type glycerol-3-phosphate transport system substrate-binding protein
MKKTALALVTLLCTATGAFADQATNNDLTLAAADLGVKTVWVETQEDAELRIAEELAEKTDALNDKINAKLEQQLETKLARELAL